MPPAVSCIIPTLNEAKYLPDCLSALSKQSIPLEIIVCDGDSDDETADIVGNFASVQFISAPRGRASQMNVGAQHAEGEILWFLHADTIVPKDAAESLRDLISSRDAIAGAFQFKLSADGILYRIIERGVKLRTRLFKVPYGDQGVFVRKEVFSKLGGYPSVPVMEDLYFWRKLKKTGEVAFCEQSLSSSARRWQEQGVVKTTAVHWLMVILDWCGASSSYLASLRSRLLGARVTNG